MLGEEFTLATPLRVGKRVKQYGQGGDLLHFEGLQSKFCIQPQEILLLSVGGSYTILSIRYISWKNISLAYASHSMDGCSDFNDGNEAIKPNT